MTREINSRLYCVTSYSGSKRIFECDCLDDLARRVAQDEAKGYTVTSVTELNADGSRPKIAIKSMEAYKKEIKMLVG